MMPRMKTGIMADVRGQLAQLEAALRLLAEEGCERIACLGSTVEGGPDDEAVLARLRDAGATVVVSPHDAPGLLDIPPRAEAGGIQIGHETPGVSDDTLWLTGYPAPSLLRAAEILRDAPGQAMACGDLYTPLVYVLNTAGVQRRLFLVGGSFAVGDGGFLACPGSVALATQSRYGGAVMVWDSEARELAALTFGPTGERMPPRRPSVLVYCAEFDAHRPDEADLAGVEFTVIGSADDIVADVERVGPDVILMDYHLAGTRSGLDALVELRRGRDRLPAPVLAIAGNPADSQGMKAAGAVGGLPFSYLKDTTARLIHEIAG